MCVNPSKHAGVNAVDLDLAIWAEYTACFCRSACASIQKIYVCGIAIRTATYTSISAISLLMACSSMLDYLRMSRPNIQKLPWGALHLKFDFGQSNIPAFAQRQTSFKCFIVMVYIDLVGVGLIQVLEEGTDGRLTRR